MLSTWSFTQVTRASHASCSLPGTSLEAERRSIRPRMITTAPAMTVEVIVSVLKVSGPRCHVGVVADLDLAAASLGLGRGQASEEHAGGDHDLRTSLSSGMAVSVRAIMWKIARPKMTAAPSGQ